jgi:hypothetical protein
MRTHVRLMTIATASLFVLVGASGARADTVALKGRIPFAFTAGSKTLAPGTYLVQRSDVSPGIILVRGAREGAFLIGQSASPNRADARPRLVFRRYGSRYFLREIWFAGTSGRLVPETKADREEAANLAKKPASLAALASTVIVEATVD